MERKLQIRDAPNMPKQGITNMLALPIDKMLYIYYSVHTLNTKKNPFQSKQSKHFHRRSWFTECEIDSNKVKLPKVGSNAIVLVPPQGQGPTKTVGEIMRV